jgi:hypothetical protein
MTANNYQKFSIQSFTRKAGRFMWIAISIIIVCVIMLAGVLLLAWSPGKPSPILDENGNTLAGSLSEKTWVEINGVQQGMFIKSRDVNNPLLLFVHGGPGMPEYWLTRWYPHGQVNYFSLGGVGHEGRTRRSRWWHGSW